MDTRIRNCPISAGINLQSSETFVTIGTNPYKQLFGEGRIGTGGNIGIELMGGYNVIQKQDVNFYFGPDLGLDDDRDNGNDNNDDFYLAIPFGLLVKPFAKDNYGIVLEAAPIFADSRGDYFHGWVWFQIHF
ncbi:MAG: hypothetical protein ACI9UV_000415 [Algoriphagus sp.]